MTNPGQLKYKKLGSGAGEKILEKENDEKKTLTYQVLCLVLICKYGFIEGKRLILPLLRYLLPVDIPTACGGGLLPVLWQGWPG